MAEQVSPDIEQLRRFLDSPGAVKALVEAAIKAKQEQLDPDSCPHHVYEDAGAWNMEIIGKPDARLVVCKECGHDVVITPFEFKQLKATA
ncbi:hypothetical protein KKF61_04125 [Patescibacteria group bacterium]|nr:hypothetical protein [Patescibacteria group bacterium]MBU0963809.1 hypothetical protein [Patescibacteria group bacterium]